MKEQEFYLGFSKEKQEEYEKQLIDRFGDQAKQAIAESHQNVRNWTKANWEQSKQEFDALCKECNLKKMGRRIFKLSLKRCRAAFAGTISG